MSSTTSIADLRQEYTRHRLDEADVLANPIAQFKFWFEEAQKAEVPEPNAMHLATVSPEGRPSLRVVLLKGIEEDNFVFFTNYESQKGQELIQQPFASLNFFWAELERQVRIEGRVEKVSEAESEAYFQSRPRGSQLGAWVSPQSREVPGRHYLEEEYARLEAEYAGTIIPRPLHWGGFRVIPDRIEFWQGRPSRLHDRINYQKQENNWIITRLAP
ncbi:MAG: pyridoxamine 5'-phosphate oxidase [Microscillaceae bacterium]|nr:pyridoxamine 5'-phosphate oxidase [Microscillaceae bacterium]